MKSYIVKVPATTANIGPGFDTLGLALTLYNSMTFTETDGGLSITVEGEGRQDLPTDESNLVYQSALVVFNKIGFHPKGLSIHLNNQVPVGSGLGSSSTAIVGGILGANSLAGEPLSKDELFAIAVEIEGHPDNVAPAMYGGLTIALDYNGKTVVNHVDIKPTRVSIVMPKINLLTSESRAAVPSVVPRSDAVFNIGRTALLIQSLQSGDYGLLKIALEDKLHQPYRMHLMPSCKEGCTAALAAGAYGAALSGAGPSLVIFAPDDKHEDIVREVRDAFFRANYGSRGWTLGIDANGATVELEQGVSAEPTA